MTHSAVLTTLKNAQRVATVHGEWNKLGHSMKFAVHNGLHNKNANLHSAFTPVSWMDDVARPGIKCPRHRFCPLIDTFTILSQAVVGCRIATTTILIAVPQGNTGPEPRPTNAPCFISQRPSTIWDGWKKEITVWIWPETRRDSHQVLERKKQKQKHASKTDHQIHRFCHN